MRGGSRERKASRRSSLVAPFERTPVQLSSGNASGCVGTLDLDFNTYVASGADPALVSGQSVWCPWWSRDGGFPPASAVSLTNALAFTLQ